jgi:hypothetical protein
VNKIVVIQYGNNFAKEYKKLAKKYKSLPDDLKKLIDQIKNDSSLGIALGNNLFKIRLAVKSKQKGKSGGLRVVSHLQSEIIIQVEKSTVTFIVIYDKSEYANISKQDLIDIALFVRRINLNQ